MKTIETSVLNPRKDMAQVVTLAHRIDAGEALPEAVPQLNFTSLSRLFSAVTEKRLELIRFVADHARLNTRRLAQTLGRDYKNVYEDVRELCDYGLIEKDEKGMLSAPYDQIVIRADLRDTQAA